MIKINRFTENEEVSSTCSYFDICQSSFNKNGNIVLRNYSSADKAKNKSDEIIILSKNETEAVFELVRTMTQVCSIKDLPF